MPKPRPPRPSAPPRASPELIRLVRENWALIQWKEAVNNEAWRLVRAVGSNRCARNSMTPPGYDESRY